ncbi:NUDIX domain-containing protein [Luteimicrobium sp. NPDC057192]|uniref:NUDIX domain-containing protein n=1 Tax=Luteimicrobium sp. NPDC057192 TaxID=3346042 RepID=UPI0036441F99
MSPEQAAVGPESEEPVVRDVLAPRPVLRRELVHHGRIWDVVTDEVELGGGTVVSREVVDHPGAVAVVALDGDDRVLLLRQYRHPVGRELWEVPAGLLDVAGEPAEDAAARELGEEADLRAARWDVLTDYYTSPGGSSEALRVFLARDLSPVPDAERHVREDEERDIELRWVALDDAVAAVLTGAVHNPSAVVGVLAAHVARSAGWSTLRPVDAPWPERRTATMMERAAAEAPGADGSHQA